ncbi:DUF6313 family protein [Kitasatospora sp. NPDC054939]
MVLDRDALGGIPHWVATTGKWIVGALVALFLQTCFFLGWSNAWDILVGRLSPRNLDYPYLVWPLSVCGWLIVPALIGALAGASVSTRVGRRRQQSMEEIAERAAQRAAERSRPQPRSRRGTAEDEAAGNSNERGENSD